MGILSKTYGGAELIKTNTNITSFSQRFNRNSEAKKKIANKAKTLINDGDVIFLDQSSTSYYLAREIINNPSITVVTNNVEILSLFSSSSINVISSGGMLSQNNRNCLLGTDAQYIFQKVHAHTVFFSTKAISYTGTIYDCVREEVLIRNSMLKNAEKKVYLFDNEKLGETAPYIQTTLKDIDFLVGENDMYKSFITDFPSIKIL